jgi:hypothetical protein
MIGKSQLCATLWKANTQTLFENLSWWQLELIQNIISDQSLAQYLLISVHQLVPNLFPHCIVLVSFLWFINNNFIETLSTDWCWGWMWGWMRSGSSFNSIDWWAGFQFHSMSWLKILDVAADALSCLVQWGWPVMVWDFGDRMVLNDSYDEFVDAHVNFIAFNCW